MAYGRFNQAAQPGDGIKEFWGVIGPYDYAAIKWGYGDFGKDGQAERKALTDLANTFAQNRALHWGAAEISDEIGRFDQDPRVLTENVGSDRITATRLGTANFLRSLKGLDAATGGDNPRFVDTFNTMLAYHTGQLKSVAKLVAGTMPKLDSKNESEVTIVPAAEQRRAVRYLLGEGAYTLDAYRSPELIQRVAAFGGTRTIDNVQASLVADVLRGSKFALLDIQSSASASAYSSADLGRDAAAAVWGDLKAAPPAKRALQRGYIAQSRKLLDDWANGGATEAASIAKFKAETQPGAAAAISAETGDNTTYPAWLRSYLPTLSVQLDAATRAAATEGDRLHFAEMAMQVNRLQALTRAVAK
jgi:hypothetical protein